MSTLEKMLKMKEALIPKSGFNVVGIDTFAPPGEDGSIYLIGHFENREDAEAEAAKRSTEMVKVFIYDRTSK